MSSTSRWTYTPWTQYLLIGIYALKYPDSEGSRQVSRNAHFMGVMYKLHLADDPRAN